MIGLFRHLHPRPLVVSLEEILPSDKTPARIRARAVYGHYAQSIIRQKWDVRLRPFRDSAWRGALTRQDFADLIEILTETMQQAQELMHHQTGSNFQEATLAYARVNHCAMLIAQALFVDNCVKEGLFELLQLSAKSEVLGAVTKYVSRCSEQNGSPVEEKEAAFYAGLLMLQTTFDKIFVPDEDIVTYEIESGQYQVTEAFDEAIGYLALADKKRDGALDLERRLCYDITTGWSEGVDLRTWDKLNTLYYSAVSLATGKENLFAKNYDVLLERMLPQFALSKVLLAETILQSEYTGQSLEILEVGAGSGAFAIDLLMACRRLQIPPEQIEYCGLEPSTYMRHNFRSNMEHKLRSADLPGNWRLQDGRLESVTAEPEKYLIPRRSTVVVLCFSVHHCFAGSVKSFFDDPMIKRNAKAIYVLEAVPEHGWTKPYYMWADCESPENFDNALYRGIWHATRLWAEPRPRQPGAPKYYDFCQLHKLK